MMEGQIDREFEIHGYGEINRQRAGDTGRWRYRERQIARIREGERWTEKVVRKLNKTFD